MTKIRSLTLLRRSEDGATTVEFALYSMVFFAMLFGGIYASLLGFTAASLQSAVESAARCSAMGVTNCTDAASTQTYAASKFHNVTGNTATFVYTLDANCGNKVTGQVNYNLKWLNGSRSLQLNAQACFPAQSASGT